MRGKTHVEWGPSINVKRINWPSYLILIFRQPIWMVKLASTMVLRPLVIYIKISDCYFFTHNTEISPGQMYYLGRSDDLWLISILPRLILQENPVENNSNVWLNEILLNDLFAYVDCLIGTRNTINIFVQQRI